MHGSVFYIVSEWPQFTRNVIFGQATNQLPDHPVGRRPSRKLNTARSRGYFGERKFSLK